MRRKDRQAKDLWGSGTSGEVGFMRCDEGNSGVVSGCGHGGVTMTGETWLC